MQTILYGWAMEQNLPVGGFKWVNDVLTIDEDFIKNCDENSGIGYFLDLHGDLPFLPERMKINKCSKLVCNLNDKTLCCSHKCFKTSVIAWFKTKKAS